MVSRAVPALSEVSYSPFFALVVPTVGTGRNEAFHMSFRVFASPHSKLKTETETQNATEAHSAACCGDTIDPRIEAAIGVTTI
jgi:hypothetical protein